MTNISEYKKLLTKEARVSRIRSLVRGISKKKGLKTRVRSLFGRKPKPTITRRRALIAGGAGTGAGLGGAAFTFGRKKKVVEYTDKSKSRIRWRTYKGGPILVGPTHVMKNLFRVGRQDRKKGLMLLKRLLDQGVIRKDGIAA